MHVSGKDGSVTSRDALLSTGPGKQIIRQGLFKSKGYKLFNRYKKETEDAFAGFAERFASDLLDQIKSDPNPGHTQQKFADEVGSEQMALGSSDIDRVKSHLENPDAMQDRVARILDSNFVKMTFPVFNALYDAASEYAGHRPDLKQDVIEGHIIAIDLSEPMDRIVDRDEDLEFLDDYKLMNPYILAIARKKIARAGDRVLASFEAGFAEARQGQYIDEMLKSTPNTITYEQMTESYKKYRSVMGTAGKNMALAQGPLGEIFGLGMGRAAEGVGCGNEMEDSLKNRFVKVPSWPLYYLTQAGNVKKGFDLTLKRANLYLQEADSALDLLPEDFGHREFLKFLFLTVQHYNQFWYDSLNRAGIWSELESKLPRDDLP